MRAHSALCAIALLLALLFVPITIQQNEFVRTLEDACHGPIFALVAICTLYLLGATSRTSINRYTHAFVLAVAAGVAAEITQRVFTTTHYAQLKDVITDAAGAIAGLSLHAYTQRARLPRLRRQLAILAGLMVLWIAAPVLWSGMFYLKRDSQVPLLVTWENRRGWHFITAGGASATLAVVPSPWAVTPEERALYVSPDDTRRWAGITLEEPFSDWTSYRTLLVTVINPNEQALELTLRIDDSQHNQEYEDRFNRLLHINPEQRVKQAISLSEIRDAPATRQLALNEISKLVLFEDTEQSARAFYLSEIRLVK